jgi:hypothetical protein
MRSFGLVTLIDADCMLGNFDVKGYGRLMLKHIQEYGLLTYFRALRSLFTGFPAARCMI